MEYYPVKLIFCKPGSPWHYVRLALQTEQPKAVIADELGINRNTLYTWIQKAMQERVDLPKTKNQNISVKYQNFEEENRTLRAKIKRIEQERDI